MSLKQRIQGLAFGLGLGALLVSVPMQLFASGGHGEEGGHGAFGLIFLMLAVVLFAGKVGNLIERYGQPAVLGELLAGIVLSALGYFGLGLVDEIRSSEVISFISEFGAVLLLFAIGLESNIVDLKKVGTNAFIVAIIGVVSPLVVGTWVMGPLFFPEAEFIAHLFLGASMVATSVGITASVFKSMDILKTRAAQTVLGAAVIDDILGLIVLAIVSALAGGEELTAAFVGILALKAFGFLAGSLIVGKILTPYLSKLFSSINSGSGMKLALAMTFALVFAYLASLVGLAPIIGAFAAGLLLDAVHFEGFVGPKIAVKFEEAMSNNKIDDKELKDIIKAYKHGHVEKLVAHLALVFVPIFFVFTGLQIEFESLLDPKLYIAGGVIGLVAVLTKVIAGYGAKGDMKEKLVVGASMVPRGEVGLIFAAAGIAAGAINAEEFSTIIIVVIITTFVAPFLIKKFSTGVKLPMMR